MQGKLDINGKKVRWIATNNIVKLPPSRESVSYIYTQLSHGKIKGKLLDHAGTKRVITWMIIH